MLRTDHCYPPTVHAPLYPTVADHHFEAITMPAPLPPVVEPLAPSPQRTNNPPLPEVTLTDDDVEVLWHGSRRARAAWTPTAATIVHHRPGIAARTQPAQAAANATARALLDAKPKPPRRVSWLACAIGAALFAVGYLLGRWLP